MDEPTESKAGLELRVGHIRLGLQPGQSLVLGSAEDCDVRLAHGDVSPRHALLRVHDTGVHVDDLDSDAGTRVDGKRVRQFDLKPGDTAVLGKVPILLVRSTSDVVTAPVSAEASDDPLRCSSMRNLPIRMREEATFRDLMSEELRRTPWFTISLVIHLLMLLLFYEMLQPKPVGDPRSVAVSGNESRGDSLADMLASADEPIEIEHPDPISELELENQDSEETDSVVDESAWNWPVQGGVDDNKLLMTKVARRTSAADVLDSAGRGLDAEGFRETVNELRKTSLEIVFVFDSTGSMGPVLDMTKARIARMLEVLQALVPDARVGIVTYRDHGQDEDYLTRSIPLGQDFYRAINFMQVISANGGGERPEAVLAGLKAAFDQRWRRGARRVVMLIGDAPPHRDSMRAIDRETRSFAREDTSYVHGIVTSSRRGRPVQRDTMATFERIVTAGNGQCVPFQDNGGLLLQVLSLAFGEEYRSNLEEVYRIVDSRSASVSPTVMSKVSDGDAALLRRSLAATPVSDELVRAVVKRPNREVAMQLVDIMSRARYPEPGRHAASFALQNILNLRRPPLDPEKGGRLGTRDARNLSELVKERFQQAGPRESR